MITMVENEKEVMKTCRKCGDIFVKGIVRGICPKCGSTDIEPLYALRSRQSFVDGLGGGP